MSTQSTPANEQVTAITRAEMPALDAPAINATEPLRSYKPPFGASQGACWDVSEDQGKTKKSSGLTVLAGLPFMLRLEISKATWQEGRLDYRLRFQFTNKEGELEELNLNALNERRGSPGEFAITGPARSLLGALMAIAESEDDAYCFSQGCRMTLRPGQRGSAFVELDVVGLDSQGNPTWVKMSTPQNTTRVPQGPGGLTRTVRAVSQRLVGLGVLQPCCAVSGEPEPEEAFTEVPVVAATVVEELED